MKQFNLDEYIANPLKKVVTRDGRAVKIYCTDYIDTDSGSIIAKIEGEAYSNSFRENGRYVLYEETNNDLFFAPERHEGWINVYRGTNTGITSFGTVLYASRKEAEEVGKSDNYYEAGKSDNYYVATAKIEWEE